MPSIRRAHLYGEAGNGMNEYTRALIRAPVEISGKMMCRRMLSLTGATTGWRPPRRQRRQVLGSSRPPAGTMSANPVRKE